ncbi:ras-related protein Rab-10-like isoform X3 [Dreissena polymorpha]|uniref:ras-related protein Rab-10-like isoform X3 n=1 Tax=Dreissena polymorpha TaxID=45954 RepID=UPI00226415FD|nr:ras-related protein Rab-10-like isoform X3 [Dreissena polymorpha]
MTNYDIVLRILQLGDHSVGKSAVLNAVRRPKADSFRGRRQTTSNRPFVTVEIEMCRDKRRLLLKAVDTGGQEKFRSLTASYYRGAHGCLLLFDVTNETTFKNVAYWLYDLREHSTQPDVCTILVGTRCHVPLAERAVSTERAEKFAESEGLTYMEISAEEGINVMEVFEKMADLIIAKLAKAQLIITQPQDTVKLPRKPTQPKKEICSC